MSKQKNSFVGVLKDFTKETAGIFVLGFSLLTPRGRADYRLRRHARAEERARVMPPKGWHPGQPYVTPPKPASAPPPAQYSPETVEAATEAASSYFASRRKDLRRSSSSSQSPVPSAGKKRSDSGKLSAAVPPIPPRRFIIPGANQPKAALPPLSRRELLIRNSLAVLAVLILGIIVNLFMLGHLQHAAAQQQLSNEIRKQLAAATAPVSEGNFEKVLLQDGDPVAVIDIPSINVHEVVVEGTSSGDLKAGPGHRRDTVLPGQAGTSIIMGRAAAYGGPFANLQNLQLGAELTVTTGQGKHTYKVLSLRYAGDPAPPVPTATQGRLILETARGPAYVPTGVVRIDAQQVSKVMNAGARQTTYASLPVADKELATDTRTVWGLIFALQFLILVEVLLVWSFYRMGLWRTWVVFVPVSIVAGLLVADQITNLLPNLL